MILIFTASTKPSFKGFISTVAFELQPNLYLSFLPLTHIESVLIAGDLNEAALVLSSQQSGLGFQTKKYGNCDVILTNFPALKNFTN